MIKATICVCLLAILASAAPRQDLMTKVPGYGPQFNTSVYTGYLNLGTDQRATHYVFVESQKGANNKDPVTLWMNGGPGCSSLIGFLQEIGPYFLKEGIDYRPGDNLTWNEHSWHQVSNLLFLESPAGVGYSYNLNKNYTNENGNTAMDNLNAVLDFFVKYPEYKTNPFWIAGESYAGVYIPNLAQLIDNYNQDATTANKINMKGLFIGNGVISFVHFQKAEVNYFIDRYFSDPEVRLYWDQSCQFDPLSAGCRYFTIRFRQDIDQINPYNVYSYCYYNDSFNSEEPQKKKFITQESILMTIKQHFAKDNTQTSFKDSKYNAAPCSYFDGMFDYFNLHDQEYHAKFEGQRWNGPCAEDIKYTVDMRGSTDSWIYLMGRNFDNKYQFHLYNGNWDAVVPYHDTIEHIRGLGLSESYVHSPWFTDRHIGRQHSGFHQLFSGLLFTTVKGASHMVPQSKRSDSFNLFNMTLAGHTGQIMEELKQKQREVEAQLLKVMNQ